MEYEDTKKEDHKETSWWGALLVFLAVFSLLFLFLFQQKKHLESHKTLSENRNKSKQIPSSDSQVNSEKRELLEKKWSEHDLEIQKNQHELELQKKPLKLHRKQS